MPDYWLLWHNTLILFLVLTLAPLPFVLVERLAPAFAARYKLQPRARLSRAAVGRYFRDTIAVFTLVIGPYQLLSYPVVKAEKHDELLTRIIKCALWVYLLCLKFTTTVRIIKRKEVWWQEIQKEFQGEMEQQASFPGKQGFSQRQRHF
ncbi:hypothetical protein C2845_PM14G05090 [Panicum miliaceum]|uniref:Uncharacterized protein n=1 Tax=Panicum miliaceum TaxID=4540 RepID=A0A3L6PSL5_PANMI|nr:hypothetical protein C2845_PM14G05090 [Panicum miliaceum]